MKLIEVNLNSKTLRLRPCPHKPKQIKMVTFFQQKNK